MPTLNDYQWQNRTIEGLELDIDGYGQIEEHEIVTVQESATRNRESLVEQEDQN